MYYTLVYPNFIYCQTLWGPAGATALKQLYLSQKRIMRTITGTDRNSHSNNHFLRLKTLKLEDINIYCTALYVFKAVNNLIENKYFQFRTNEFHRLRHTDLLQVPIVRSTQSQKFVNYHGVKVWNALPAEIRDKTSVNSFKFSLKKYLLDKYRNS